MLWNNMHYSITDFGTNALSVPLPVTVGGITGACVVLIIGAVFAMFVRRYSLNV